MAYKHKEAFCLMYYEERNGNSGFVIWNSRDGVTPFIIFEGGIEYVHKHWVMDKVVIPANENYIKEEILQPGQRIFRDMTGDEAKEAAKKRINRFKGTEFELEEFSSEWWDKVEILASQWIGEPTVKIVTEKGVLP